MAKTQIIRHAILTKDVMLPFAGELKRDNKKENNERQKCKILRKN